MRWVGLVCMFCLLNACNREQRKLRPAPAREAVYGNAAREDALHPGGVQPTTEVTNPYEGNAAAIAEGGRLYNWYNCSGCHFGGGGGIGPPLIKSSWIYGGEAANIFDTIVKGRPNGMPTWGGKIPEYQIWEIVAYVRSLNNLEPTSATAARGDVIEPNGKNIQNKVNGVTR